MGLTGGAGKREGGGYGRGGWRREEGTIIQRPCIPRKEMWTESSMRNQKNERSCWLLCGEEVRKRELEDVLRVCNTSVLRVYNSYTPLSSVP